MKILQIKVKPNARQSKFEQQADGSWVAQVTAPPVDGKANAMLIAMVADYFGLRKSQVSLKTGANGRWKLIEIED